MFLQNKIVSNALQMTPSFLDIVIKILKMRANNKNFQIVQTSIYLNKIFQYEAC